MAYSDDGLPLGRHIVGDVFRTLDNMYSNDLWPSAAVFHPDCTYLTSSAEWAYGDGPYHQAVLPGTLVGAARRAAREEAVDQVLRLRALKIRTTVFENPVGHLSQRIGRPTQIVQPYEFGDDASKKTCLWVYEDGELVRPRHVLPLDPAKRVPGRLVRHFGVSARKVERWANQTDSGQNRLPPGTDRWKDRARTFPGIADALVRYVIGRMQRD